MDAARPPASGAEYVADEEFGSAYDDASRNPISSIDPGALDRVGRRSQRRLFAFAALVVSGVGLPVALWIAGVAPFGGPSIDQRASTVEFAIPRGAWTRNLPPPSVFGTNADIDRITIHHEGDAPVNFSDRRTTARRIENIRRYHTERNGWSDIGYHFVVDRAGRVWEARRPEYRGAHAGNRKLNDGNLGIMLIGNFDQQEVTSAQSDGLHQLLDALLESHELDSEAVTTHGSLVATDCPGRALTEWVDEWRRNH